MSETRVTARDIMTTSKTRVTKLGHKCYYYHGFVLAGYHNKKGYITQGYNYEHSLFTLTHLVNRNICTYLPLDNVDPHECQLSVQLYKHNAHLLMISLFSYGFVIQRYSQTMMVVCPFESYA